MEVIIEKNCENREGIVGCVEQLESFLQDIVTIYNLNSLKYFVVADSSIENYASSAKKYAALVNSNIYLTNNESYKVAGKSMDGISDDGMYGQAIIVKSSLMIAMYNDFARQDHSENLNLDRGELNNIGLMTIVHEFGHAIDNANIYSLRGFVNTKIMYDMSYELDDYIENISYSLWGEYFAETFPYRILDAKYTEIVVEGKEKNLIECIRTYSKGKNKKAIVERIYRILYFFVQCISSRHFCNQIEFDYEKYMNIENIARYVPYFALIEVELVSLLKTYPNWDENTCMENMKKIIIDMVEFEICN